MHFWYNNVLNYKSFIAFKSILPLSFIARNFRVVIINLRIFYIDTRIGDNFHNIGYLMNVYIFCVQDVPMHVKYL